jgi:outer membrane protein assembly factor BamB
VLDAQQRLVTPLPGGVVARFDGRDLAALDEFDVSGSLLPGEGITSVVPDWSGLLWFVGREGTVGLLDPASGNAASLLAGPGGTPVDIENSFAVTERGAYVVTGEELMRVEAVDGAPVIVWRAAYDRGTRLKPGQTSRASGTTPTVFGAGGRYVAITDNADPRMRVVVFDVSGQNPRELCAVPVFAEGESATENSLIAMGDALIVESNYGYSVTAVAGGHTTTPGLARIDVTDAGCSLGWETDAVTIPSLVSKGVLADGAVLTYTKESSALGTDAWWFTAVDASTGELLWRRLAGVGPLLNNHYAAGYVGPDGSVYVGTISGVVALISTA